MVFIKLESGHRYGAVAAFEAGTAGVDAGDGSTLKLVWLMGMAENNNIDTRGFKVKVDHIYIMDYVDRKVADLDKVTGWISAPWVHIAGNRMNRGDGIQVCN